MGRHGAQEEGRLFIKRVHGSKFCCCCRLSILLYVFFSLLSTQRPIFPLILITVVNEIEDKEGGGFVSSVNGGHLLKGEPGKQGQGQPQGQG